MSPATKTRTLLDQLAELEAEIPKREAEVQQAQTEHSRRIRELAAARGRRNSYHREVAFGERKAYAKEEARLDQAVHEIERHIERTADRGAPREVHLVAQAKHEAAIARLDAARSDLARFIDATAGGLLEELREQAEGSMREALDEALVAINRFGVERQKISRVGATIAERLNLPRRMPPSPIEVDHRLADGYVPLPVSLLERLGIGDRQITPSRPTNYVS